jgi:CheY-like chemotaxis protein
MAKSSANTAGGMSDDCSLVDEQEVIDVLDSAGCNRPPPREAEQGRVADTAGPPERSLVTARACGILVVDDEEGVRGVLKVRMRQQGFTVWLAADGQEALDLYRRHREDIDVVLLDVRMPGRDGPQTLAALQQLNPQIRCCFMSGDLGSYTEERLRGLGAAAVLPKPFHLDEVAQALWELATHATSSCGTGLPDRRQSTTREIGAGNARPTNSCRV